eukprot:CAMPEP_0183715472 /NCGR_PEP_ID=MMETSP0737-20130205/9671_1 /TAXON_ID=385413 /ORGANISM="Thalassiosira miniscula, Strain CCMP1093" /LENGTH=1569 /DNA_ID=CAMNT_0025944567 /DNA_START=70 /DNA_END=4779 /DNA_ORIENTATION=+
MTAVGDQSYGAIRDQNGTDAKPVDDVGTDAAAKNETAPLLSSASTSDKAAPSSSSLGSILGGYWTHMTFNWISPLLERGNANGTLNVEDLESLPLPKDCTTTEVYDKFSKCWEEELEKARRSNEKEEKRSDNNKDSELTSTASTIMDEEDFPNEPPLDPNNNAYQPSLILALYRAFGSDFLRAGLLKLIHDANLFVGPQVLNRLIQFLRNSDAPLGYGMGLTAIAAISQIIMSISLRHYFYKCYNCGLRIRTAVVLAIYQKSLVLSLKERHAHGGPGEIANLVGIDAQRLQDLMTYLHAVWYSFFQIGLALYFLWGQVGPSCLVGALVIALLIPITKFIAAWLGKIQKLLMKARDERVALNNEILGAMKVIKIQAWEENFASKLLELREHELKRLKKYFIAGSTTVTMFSSTPMLVALATFAAYTLAGNDLDVAEALTALALFDILRFPLFMLPQIINRIVEAGISFERVRSFLLSEEYSSVGEGRLKEMGEVWMKNGTFVYDSKKPRLEDDDKTTDKGRNKGGIAKLRQKHRRMMQEAALDRQWEMTLLKAQLKDAEDKINVLEKELHPELTYDDANDGGAAIEGGKWTPSSLLSLRRVCMHCRPGELVAVVGGVGSGKSTLINSILGEGRPLTGSELAVKGKLGAFLQTPFIMNDTVRNNILFGHASNKNAKKEEKDAAASETLPVDEERYKLAVEVCSLSHDLKLLPHGDQTEIGEKGITLSGGQKARVALARAVYHDADVYLLDDPLAAVDAHVGKDLFNKCIIDELVLGKSKWKKEQQSNQGDERSGSRTSWSEMLLGKSPSKRANPDDDDEKDGPERNATVILVTNALQHLSHSMVDKILVLGDGCVEEVGTFQELSSDPNSRFSAFLKTMAETSTAAIEQIPSDSDSTEGGDGDDASENALDFGGDEPEVTKIIHNAPRRDSDKASRTRLIKKASINDDVANEEGDNGGALMSDEFKEREKGSVNREVYLSWARAAGGVHVGVSILLFFVVVESLNVTSKWWLTYWSQHNSHNPFFYLGIYGLVNMSAILATLCRLLLFVFAGLRASRSMFEQLLGVVLQAPMSFFDTTPIGRIINRFSKDLYTVDEQLVLTGRSYLATAMVCISTVFVVTAVTPIFLFGLVPIFIYYLHQQRFFTMSYRELKRLDSISRSPIYALLGETLDGVLTIRAFDAQESLNRRMVGMIDTQQSAYHLTFASQCWLSIRLEFAGAMIVMFACLVAVLEHITRGGDEHFAGLAGLSISFALSITTTLSWTVRMASDLEANMVAVERIQQYMKIPGEAARATPSDEFLPDNWPAEGRIEFANAKLKYRSNLPLVLKGLNINIPARCKVGVVGRTGAGKSTLMVALLRIVELYSGSIKIDDVDIRSVGLKKLRSVIAVIPQDPVLFSGTIRSNLDPFGEYDDERLFEVLEHVGLYAVMERVSSKLSLTSAGSDKWAGGRTQPIKSLSEEVSEGGSNFSVGQRQLLVIARAMLTGASIVIMDEATASVDADTDARIQRVFRSEFKNATCITVAHRLNTIMDSDLVLVMDDGKAAEFDRPSTLLSQENGIFKSLVDAWEEEN